MATVELERVNKIFPDGTHAVRDVSLFIEDGEFMVLVGPSGCAKSTTLNMIAGLEAVSSGRVRIGGRDVTHLPPKDRDVAMVFQSYALYPHMSVRQNMAFGLKLRRMDRQEIAARVDEAARILEIAELLDRRPRELSGGQRQRVALGRAIVRKPQVFLFDEPLSNLDAKLRAQMRVELAALHRNLGATVVYVTHDQTEAMTLGRRITVLDRGVVKQVDRPLTVYTKPANRFTAQFIGSPSMNMLPARLERDGDGYALRLVTDTEDAESPASGDALLRLPEKTTRLLEEHGATDVLFGIRPEHVTPAEDGSGEGEAGRTLPVRVDLVERMGNEGFAHVTCAGERVVCEVAPDADFEPGQRVRVRFAMEHCHVFDPESGENLSLRQTGDRTEDA